MAYMRGRGQGADIRRPPGATEAGHHQDDAAGSRNAMWLTGMPPYASMMGHGGVPQEIQQLQLLRQQQLAQQQLAVVQQQQAHAQQMYKMWLAQHGPSEARARSELESTAATLSSMGAGRGQGFV